MHRRYEAIPTGADSTPQPTAPTLEGGFKALQRRFSFFEKNIKYEKDMPTRNIVSYDTSALYSLGWLLPLRGSVCNFKLLGTVIAQVIVTTVLAFNKCTDDDTVYRCIPLPSNTTGLTLLTITSFLVGIFSNNVLQRWWNIRVALGMVIIKSKSLALSVASTAAISTIHSSVLIKTESLQLVHRIKRYLNLAHALIYKRGSHTVDLSDLIARGLVTVREAELLQDNMLSPQLNQNGGTHQNDSSRVPFDLTSTTFHSTNPLNSATYSSTYPSEITQPTTSTLRPSRRASTLLSFQVYSWIRLLLEQAASVGLLGGSPTLPHQHIVTYFFDVATLEASAAQVDMYVGIQLPYPFVQMAVIIIHMFLIQLMVVCGGIIGEGMQTHDGSMVIVGYMTSILMTFVMMGVLHMYDMISCNPVGDIPGNDNMKVQEAEIERLISGLWKSSSTVNDDGSSAVIPNLTFTMQDLASKV